MTFFLWVLLIFFYYLESILPKQDYFLFIENCTLFDSYHAIIYSFNLKCYKTYFVHGKLKMRFGKKNLVEFSSISYERILGSY